eukprot:TRINITY_DN44181_c0_g1_i1.p1 TRINITY_DN44181_c0_g1~~TRINITY_DN44181_c0_g1_i1.p1  ORF type:complete len:78 (-),score=19.60 TRINITY_DN44181_c0_g1_i1:55-288(-)
MADDGWDDDNALQAPKYIGTYIVTRDYIPESNDYLTLELDNVVYLFDKNTSKPGYWLGETKGLTGLFPSSYVKEIKE